MQFLGMPFYSVIYVKIMYKNGTAQKLISDFLLRSNFTVTYKHILNESADHMSWETSKILYIISGYSDFHTPIALHKNTMKVGDPSQDV